MEVIGLPLRGKVAVEDRRMSSLHDFFPFAHKLPISHKPVGGDVLDAPLPAIPTPCAQTSDFTQIRPPLARGGGPTHVGGGVVSTISPRPRTSFKFLTDP